MHTESIERERQRSLTPAIRFASEHNPNPKRRRMLSQLAASKGYRDNRPALSTSMLAMICEALIAKDEARDREIEELKARLEELEDGASKDTEGE